MRFCADPEDIKVLTGRKQARAQRKWLQDRKVRFQLDADGFPVVPIAELERVFGLDSAAVNKKKIDLSQFDEESPVQRHAKG